jgi:CRISPR-associated endonuclease/helicase Cas3
MLQGRDRQSIRHEHLSGLLLFEPSLAEYLATAPDTNRDVIAAAVFCHHLKVNEETLGRPTHEEEFEVEMRMDDLQVTGLLKEAGGKANGALLNLLWRKEDVLQRRQKMRLEARRFRKSIRQDDQLKRLTSAVKGALIVADAAGSAITRVGLTLESWLEGCFGQEVCSAEWLTRVVIDPVVAEYEKHNQRRLIFRDWQLAAAKLDSRALLLSHCGSGKTLAAWLWIREQLDKCPAARIIFLYPTRATATEGFRGYGSWAGGEDAALLHGTSEYDLEGLFQNPIDPRSQESFMPQETLFALSYWNRRILTATIDQFLSFLNCSYASVCLLPLLADSVVVIDEVHSFDASMFRSLERLLSDLSVPVLCMTATLPKDRVRILVEKQGLQPFPANAAAFPDLEAQASAPRYRMARVAGTDEAATLALAAVAAGKRVLWVANTVRRAQAYAIALQASEPGRVSCYHSRFRLSDRRERHRAAVAVFRQEGGHILVSTQVCEMSLDLDADILVTEMAPVTSLIQRMGRCCRHGLNPGDAPGEVVLIEPQSSLPYAGEDLVQAATFFRQETESGAAVSQLELGERLEKLAPNEPHASGGVVGFLDGGMYAMSADESFRETDEFTIDAVLDTDLGEFLKLRRERDASARGYICPVPRKHATKDPRLPAGVSLAEARLYDPLLGYLSEELCHG